MFSSEFGNWISGYPSIRYSSRRRGNGSSVSPPTSLPPLHHPWLATVPYYFAFLKTRADKAMAIGGFHAAFPPAVSHAFAPFSRRAQATSFAGRAVHVPATPLWKVCHGLASGEPEFGRTPSTRWGRLLRAPVRATCRARCLVREGDRT